MLFDCLALGGHTLIEAPLEERRAAVERFHAQKVNPTLLLSPATRDERQAIRWVEKSGGALDGVIAKPLGVGYQPGERAMRKMKRHRTADCVVGGFRRSKSGPEVASLLLGLYDDAGRLNHVGFTSALTNEDKAALTKRLDALIQVPGFTGKAPGGPSRRNDGKESLWHPLAPELVVEVQYDQVTADRFRHGTALVRWRPDKAPNQCRMDQLQYELSPSELFDLQAVGGSKG